MFIFVQVHVHLNDHWNGFPLWYQQPLRPLCHLPTSWQVRIQEYKILEKMIEILHL